VKKRGSGIYRGIVAPFSGCDNWIKRGSEGWEMLLRDGRDLGWQVFSVNIFRLYI
jgi:hypothetical protein